MKRTTETFIAASHKIHGDRYDYSQVVYHKALENVTIICKVHGPFEQTPANHYSGKGCYDCGRSATGQKKRIDYADFLKKATEVHGKKYDYSSVVYTVQSKKITIICPKHGSFTQTANNHLQGYGCPNCGHRISQGEEDWLQHCGVPDTPQTRQFILWVNGSRYAVDGFNPSTNTVYEYHGDYWHGNPQYHDPNNYNTKTKCTFGALYENTIRKHHNLEQAGYTVVFIWASEWITAQANAICG
jgi:hypothetical protein